MRYLDIELMEKFCHQYAVALFDIAEEPIPPFTSHTKQLLDSALQSPKQTFGEKELYPNFIDKATVLFYSLIKNHPFSNGNKRIATASLLIFMYINNYDIRVSAFNLAALALQTAESKDKEKTTNMIKLWLKDNLIKDSLIK